MKKYIIIIISILILLGLGVGTAVYMNNKNKTENITINPITELAKQDQNNIASNSEINSITTSTVSTKISPNATIIKKEYYKACDHICREIEDIPQSLINKEKEDVENLYTDWKVEVYSPTEITLYKEHEGMCDEHYVLRMHNDVIGIYRLDENGSETFYKDTEVQVQYLPEVDLEKLEDGITAIGNAQLNSVLEDFE
jgi:hypothetical protein